MFEGLFFQLACVAIQHRDRLLSSVQIATYNSHLGLLRSELCTLDTAQFTRLVVRPISLCHHLSDSRAGALVLELSFGVPNWTKHLAQPQRSARFTPPKTSPVCLILRARFH